MKWCISLCLLLLLGSETSAQWPADSITSGKADAILHYLASDSLKGRGNGSAELPLAAAFIAERFAAAGLGFLTDSNTYFQPFSLKKGSSKARQDGTLQNVIGVLEGKIKKEEAIIFSAHYDHLGVVDGATHYGANDNASGTTALLLLAEYFSRRADNERTLIFCAFAGEELGLLGSTAFASVAETDKIVAMVNLEMLGIPAVGKNAFFITGSHYSDLPDIIRKNLPRSVRVRPEPAYDKNLFRRSDNFPLAVKGIPAHTIMASDDDDYCYHQTCDKAERIDIENLANLVQAIATGCRSLVSGESTPRRINPRRL